MIRRIAVAGILSVLPFLSFGQGSGIYNGEFTEAYTPSTISNDEGCTTFYNVPNWSSVYGAPTHSGGMMHMQAGMYSSTYDMFDISSSIMGGYNWQVGTTYYVQFRFQFDGMIYGPKTQGFKAFATSGLEQKLGMAAAWRNCLGGYDMPNPSELVAEYNQLGTVLLDSLYAHHYIFYESEYTCTIAGLNQIFIYPVTQMYGYPAFHLDYVRIRKCGSGSLALSNTTLYGMYAKENISAGENTTTTVTHTTDMVGQFITLDPGFSSSPTSGSGTFTATAVTTCDMPIEPAVLSYAKEGGKAIDPSANTNHIDIYPNPARDHMTVELLGKVQGEVSYTIVDMAGRKVMALQKRYDQEIVNVKEQINTSSLEPGTYILHVSSAPLKGVRKIDIIK